MPFLKRKLLKNKIKISSVSTDYKTKNPLGKIEVRELISLVCSNEQVTCGSVGVIFVDAGHIKKLNARYLEHDYPTDVLSFPLQEPGKSLEGEIYICSEVAKAQARDYKVPFKEEMMRLIVHGMLHLIGYDDGDEKERKQMKCKEEHYLKQYVKGKVLN